MSRTARRVPEEGSALVAVASLSILLAILGVALTGRIVSGGRASVGALHREQALIAAESALVDTLQRLSTDELAGQFLLGDLGPTAFDRDWYAIHEDPQDGSEVQGRATVARNAGGELRIVSSGRSGQETRSLEARVRPWNVADFQWVTDLELVDPIVTDATRGACMVHGGSAMLPPDSGCEPADYRAEHRFDGPFHSNDAVTIVGPVEFGSSATTAWLMQDDDGAFDPAFFGLPSSAPVPPFGLGVRRRVVLPHAAAAVLTAGPTCRFIGPTVIRFLGTSIRVRSPLSVDGGTADTGPLGCPGLDATALDDFVEVGLPPAAVIEVVRGDSDRCGAHPLSITAGDDRDLERACFAGDAFVWGSYDGLRTVVAHDDIIAVWDIVRMDVADPHRAAVGLIAGDSIVLRRPVGAPLRVVAPFGTNLPFGGSGLPPFGAWPLDAPLEAPALWDSPQLFASLVALRGSVRVENPAWGQQHVGPVRIVGSVAQRFRGPFSWERRSSSGSLQARMGYELDLSYDEDLLVRVPPMLPGIGDPSLRVLELREIAPAVA
jgi:hypothetical protein